MITEIVLGVVILVILVYHYLYVRETNSRHGELVKAIMAKNLREYDDSKIIENRQKKGETDKIIQDIPEFIPMEDASDEIFEKHIQEQLGS